MTPPLGNWETFVTVAALSVGIILTRAVPFLLFSRKEKIPGVLVYLGGALPHACMTMLLVYCLKNVSLTTPPHGLAEGLGLVFTAILHRWRGNALLSIAGGTLFYMVLVQKVLADG